MKNNYDNDKRRSNSKNEISKKKNNFFQSHFDIILPSNVSPEEFRHDYIEKIQILLLLKQPG